MARAYKRRAMMTGSHASSRFVFPMSITSMHASTGCSGPKNSWLECLMARKQFKVARRIIPLMKSLLLTTLCSQRPTDVGAGVLFFPEVIGIQHHDLHFDGI
ncbi:hypothetical protein FOXG_22907 [Fusarium oxysporum f. sp. lycopersici 4287]|uniref:Uncharacterized protein n=1 Tax=Fusarium oxysporum f. sp. lycopersici (strain 4287 / CBS 123668 / FGSC 9935 / NRRL 34936) TaxID=426428 RepID=A0A0J9WW59_FUSO4|nr:uncharacterized protein FOXG_22907 [Fusarium oxysporum f. sp. lycopersici 4287]XP_018258758.1 uncharacterized protein FOXG_22907 [Fusarium oxysporum f. sp. lycopersici 4287]XP_018258759.1 uncharacterized protein FOXG_22907 [Fusarium oxysporum f. sp. lycopersici 4287]XP_018258760.1 uncharacterized protein FOXG_22907 [Fusarium oxysporum f. sp. lycopersici 4287]XP_018258761.1 uncharacterized protein FOXG_22907 [Fusarium oxysporum f. sp. lycopersici 4287]KNB20712.1 hypothetical protein FOXG_229